MINVYGIDLTSKIEITRQEAISLYAVSREVHIQAWALTFAKEYNDPTVVDLEKYRKGHLKFAAEFEAKRAAACGCDPIDIQRHAQAYKDAAAKGKVKRSYAMGLTATF